jgi:trimeric autotransporter adhesin
MRVGLHKNRFFGSGGAGKKRWIPIWVAMVWVGMGMGFGNQSFAQVRISQVYPGGGNSSATYTHDFIELYNSGTSSQSLSGWSLQYASATSTSWAVQNLSGTIAAKSYFLVSFNSGGSGTALPSPVDLAGSTSINLAASNGKVALVSSTTALAVGNPSVGVLDLLGYGSANGSEVTAASAFSTNTRSLIRRDNGETDSNNNSSDFSLVVPAPRNSASAVNPSIATSVTSLNQFSATAGTASDPQSFTVLGFGLSTTIAVTPPAGFEISSNGINYSASLSLPAVGGTVSVRIPASAASGSSPSGNITLVSSPALSRTVAVSGAVTAANSPAVSCSPTALTGFSTYAGSVSTAQTITVSGTYLTDSVVVTAASGYEVSSDNITFSSSVSITQIGGTLGGTPVYVRVSGTASVGPLSGNAASVSSSGSPVVNVSGSGTVSTPSFSLALSPNPVNEGESSTGTVSIPQARIADLVVSLTSANTSAVTVPSSLTIPAGSTSATFQATAVDNPSSYAETSSSISVSAASVTGASVTLTVNNSTPAPITPISLDGSSSNSYSQNFNGLGTNAVVKVFPASNGVQVSLGAITTNTVNGWYGAKIAGTGTSATDLLANAGTTITGTLYSFGNANDVNRALGTIATGTATMAFGALIKNDTGGTIKNVKVSFTAEFWRSSTLTSNVLTFGYGIINGTNSTETNFLTTTGATPFTALNITGPAPVTPNGSLDGDSPTNQVAYSNVALPLELGAGKTAFLRWQDLNDGGDDAGIGMDNFTLSYEVDRSVVLSSFSPAVGPAGTQVTIRGSNFSDGIPVRFNGTVAALVSVVSPTELAVTVPEGATTGYIMVGEGAGAVVSATAFVVGDFAVTTPLDGIDFGSVSVGSIGGDKNLIIMGGGLPEGTLNIESDSPDFLLSEDGSTWSSSLSIPYDGSFATPYIRFAPLTTGAKTAVVTLSSGGITVAKYTFTGTGNSIQNVTGFAAVSGNAQIGLSWTNASPSTKVIILAQQGSAVTNSPVATNSSYSANTVYGSGTQVGTSYVVFNSTGTNVTVTGLTNRLLYYFKAFNVSGDNVSSGTSVSRVPYVALSNVITQWNFNGSTTTPSSGTGTAQATGGTVVSAYAAGSPTDPLGAGGVGNFAWTLNTWIGGATETAGVQFNVSTVGKGSIVVSWDAFPSNTGPKYYRLLYTSDGSVATPVWTPYTATGSGTESGLYVNPVSGSWTIQNQADLSGVPELQNNPNAAFRLVSAYAPGTSAYAAAKSTSTAGPDGTLRFDMVTVSGVAGEFNSAPTNLTLSATTIAENNAVNTVVGTFSTTDVDSGDIFTYSLVAGEKDVDNASFNISGNSLRTRARFDFETKSSYNVRVRVTDSANNTFEKAFTIRVEDLPEALTYSSWLGVLTPSDAAFLDYVFGAVAPGTLDPSLKPTVAVTGGNLVLTYYVRQGTAGLTVTPKTSADLAASPSGWVTDGVTDIAVGTPITVNSVSVQQRAASVPVSGAKKFLKVEAVQE